MLILGRHTSRHLFFARALTVLRHSGVFALVVVNRVGSWVGQTAGQLIPRDPQVKQKPDRANERSGA